MANMAKGCLKTRLALLWMNLTHEPLIAMYNAIPFILRKDLGASTAQIALFITLSPVLAVLSFYWGARLRRRKNGLLANLIWAWVLARLPFLFLPFFDSIWFLFIACATYQLFTRASTPALMEILKRNIPKKPREHVFSFYYLLSILEGIVLGLALGSFSNGSYWKIFFSLGALLSLTSVFFQSRIIVPEKEEPPAERGPLKESLQLLRDRPDFARFQRSFMLGGLALMVMAPVKSIYYADILKISLADIALARCVFVGVGLAASSFIWKKALDRYGINSLTKWIIAGFGLFPLVLLLSPYSLSWFYAAHLVYGIAGAGSHLVWHLSGTIFAGEQDSSKFTTVNVLMVGVRGAFGPFLGAMLCDVLGCVPMLIVGAAIAFVGVLLTREPVSASPLPALPNSHSGDSRR